MDKDEKDSSSSEEDFVTAVTGIYSFSGTRSNDPTPADPNVSFSDDDPSLLVDGNLLDDIESDKMEHDNNEPGDVGDRNVESDDGLRLINSGSVLLALSIGQNNGMTYNALANFLLYYYKQHVTCTTKILVEHLEHVITEDKQTFCVRNSKVYCHSGASQGAVVAYTGKGKGIGKKTVNKDNSDGASTSKDDQGHATGDQGHATGDQGHATGDQGHGTADQGHGTADQGHGTDDQGHVTGDQGHGTADQGHGTDDQGHESGDQGHGPGDQGHGTGDQGHGTDEQGHETGANEDHGTGADEAHGSEQSRTNRKRKAEESSEQGASKRSKFDEKDKEN